jgi:hypothetical protein
MTKGTRLARIFGSAFVLKLVACATWLGLPVSTVALDGGAQARAATPAIDDRRVPFEHGATIADLKSDTSTQRHFAQSSPPPSPPPRPPVVLSVRG